MALKFVSGILANLLLPAFSAMRPLKAEEIAEEVAVAVTKETRRTAATKSALRRRQLRSRSRGRNP